MSQVKKIGVYSEMGIATGFGKYQPILMTTEYRPEQTVQKSQEEVRWEAEQRFWEMSQRSRRWIGKRPRNPGKRPPHNPTTVAVSVPIEVPRTVPPELAKTALEDPVPWQIDSATGFWIFKGSIYEVDQSFSQANMRLLVLEEFDRERRRFERLKQKYDLPEREETRIRLRIPEQVRIEVWRRDGGKCAVCGSRDNLEYDHIVPVSKGGSNTARNIELLCEKHNRSKGAKIG